MFLKKKLQLKFEYIKRYTAAKASSCALIRAASAAALLFPFRDAPHLSYQNICGFALFTIFSPQVCLQTDLMGTRETMALKIAVSREIATGDELERDANMCMY